ncbi:MAG: MarR family transcriptional regulator [Myxococcota bacterium]
MSHSEDALDEAMELLHHAFRRVIEEPDDILAAHGFGRLHHRILYVIGKNPGLATGELIGLLGVTKQAVHGPLQRLVEEELVRVERPADDRRRKQLRLTDGGDAFERRLSRCEHRVFAEAFALVEDADVAGWHRVMESLGAGRRLRLPREAPPSRKQCVGIAPVDPRKEQAS